MKKVAHFLSPANIGAVYVWGVVILIFGIWHPDTFLTWNEAKIVLNQAAIPALVALALVIPLASRSFDLSVSAMTGLASVLSAWFLIRRGIDPAFTILIVLAAAVLIGVFNATVVVLIGVDSFITTLATASLMTAASIAFTDSQPIVGQPLSNGLFKTIGSSGVVGLKIPFWTALGTLVVLTWVLDHTATGRRIYATGFNEAAARLAGVATRRLRFCALMVSAVIAGLAGILLAAQTSSGSPAAANVYLLNAFAAAFLGASQFKGGMFNAPGTIVAVLLLGTGQAGLGLVGAPVWAPETFTGLVLLAALIGTRAGAFRELWERRRRRGKASGSKPEGLSEALEAPSEHEALKSHFGEQG